MSSMASNTFRGTLRQLVDSDHNDSHQTFIDRVGQEFCLECACSQLCEPERTIVHKTHICHCLNQIAAGCEDGGGTLAHCVIPAAVLSLAGLGSSSSQGSSSGSSRAENKLQDALSELILELQASLSTSEMNAFLELVVQEISAGGCWPRRYLIKLLARSVRSPHPGMTLASKPSGLARMISSSRTTILAVLSRRHPTFLNRLFGATLNCPQPEPLSDILAVLDAAAASPFNKSPSGDTDLDSDAAEPARVCLAVLCSSDGDLDSNEKKTGNLTRAARLVRRLEKAGHNGCWVSCMSALTHLARYRMHNIAAGFSSSVAEDSDLEGVTTDRLLDSIVLGSNTLNAAGTAGSKYDSSIMRIGVTGRSQLTRPDCPDATVAAAGLFEILATLRSRYARQLMRDGVAEFTVAGLGHSNRSAAGGAVALALANLLDALSTAEPIAFFHPSHFHPFALQALVEALTIQAGNYPVNEAPPTQRSFASQEVLAAQGINKHRSAQSLNGQQQQLQALSRMIGRMPATGARTCAPLARVLRRASSHSTSGEYLGAPQLITSLAHVIHSAINTAAAVHHTTAHGLSSNTCMDNSGNVDMHVNHGASDIECLDLAIVEILRTVETILTQVLHTAPPSLQQVSHRSMNTDSGYVDLSEVVQSVLMALFKAESRLAERSDSVQAASLALAAAWAAGSSSAVSSKNDVLAWTAALVFGEGVGAVEAIVSGRSGERSAGPAATHALAVLVAILLDDEASPHQKLDRLQQVGSSFHAPIPGLQNALAQHLCDSGYLLSLLAALAASAARKPEDLHTKYPDQSAGTEDALECAAVAASAPDHHVSDTALTVAFVAVIRQLIPPGIAMIDSVTALAERCTSTCTISSSIKRENTIAAFILKVIRNGVNNTNCIDTYASGNSTSSDLWPHLQSFQAKDDDMFQRGDAGNNDEGAIEVAMLVLSMSPMDAYPSTISTLVLFLCRHFVVQDNARSHLNHTAAQNFAQIPSPAVLRTGVHLLSAAARLNSVDEAEDENEYYDARSQNNTSTDSSNDGGVPKGINRFRRLPVDLSSTISDRLLPTLAYALNPIARSEHDLSTERSDRDPFSAQDPSILLALLARGNIPRLLLCLPPSPSLDEVLWYLAVRNFDDAEESTEGRVDALKTAASAAIVVRQLFDLRTCLDECEADTLAAALLREANRRRRDLAGSVLGLALGLAAELALPTTHSEHPVSMDATKISLPILVKARSPAYSCPLLCVDLVAAAHASAALALSDDGGCEVESLPSQEFSNGALRALAALAIRTAASALVSPTAPGSKNVPSRDLLAPSSHNRTNTAWCSDGLYLVSLTSVLEEEPLSGEAITPLNYDPSKSFCGTLCNKSNKSKGNDSNDGCEGSNHETALVGALVQCAPLLVMVACGPSTHNSSNTDIVSDDRYCSRTAALSTLAAVAWAALVDGRSNSLALLRTLHAKHGPAIAGYLTDIVMNSSQNRMGTASALSQCAAAMAFLAATTTGTTAAVLQDSKVPNSLSRKSPQFKIPSMDCPPPPLSVRTFLALIDPLHPASILSKSERFTNRYSSCASTVSCFTAEQSDATGAGLLASSLHFIARLLLVDRALAHSSRKNGTAAATDESVETDEINLSWWWCGANERLRLRSAAHHHALSPIGAISEAACVLLLALRATTVLPSNFTRQAATAMSGASNFKPSSGDSLTAARMETAAGKSWCDEWHRVVIEELLSALKIDAAGTNTAVSNTPVVTPAVVRPGPFALLLLAATVQTSSVVPWVRDAFSEQCDDDVPVRQAKETTASGSLTTNPATIRGVIGGLIRAFHAECVETTIPGASAKFRAVQACHLHLFCCLQRTQLLSDRATKAIVKIIPAPLRSELTRKYKERNDFEDRSAGWWVLSCGLSLPCDLDCGAHVNLAGINCMGLGETLVHPQQLQCASLIKTLIDASPSCVSANEERSQRN